MKKLAWVIVPALVTLWIGAMATPSPTKEAVLAKTETVTPKPIDVVATVRPKETDFPLSLTSRPESTAVIGTNSVVTFTITYGSTLAMTAPPLTITADWSLGSTVSGSREAFEAFRYVPGSSTKGWGGVRPIIDVTRRKITWHLPSLPPKTLNQTVSFALITPIKSITQLPMTTTVKARIQTNSVTTLPRKLTFTFDPTVIGPKQPTDLAILDVAIRKVGKESFSLFVETSQPTMTTISYGKDPDLGLEAVDTRFASQKIITIGGLEPLTTYYFALRAATIDGRLITTPDLFVVTTAGSTLLEMINFDNSKLSISGVTLKNRTSFAEGGAPLVPKGKHLDIGITFRSTVPALVYLRFAAANVLGITTDDTPLPMEKVRLFETEPGEMSALVLPPQEPGLYDMIIETADIDSVITQDVLSQIRITNPLTVKDSQGNPIEGAEVYVEHFDPTARTFGYFPSESFNQRNPAFSDSDGTVGFIFPKGTYRATARAINYQSKDITFTFSPTTDEGYPAIVLSAAPFSVGNWIRYYGAVTWDTAKYFNNTFDGLVSSRRIVNLSLVTQALFLVVVSIMLTAHRFTIALEDILLYAEKYWRMLTLGKNRRENLFMGFLEDRDTGFSLHGATVSLVSGDSTKAIRQSLTNFLGEFHIPLSPAQDQSLIIRKSGYVSVKIHLGREELENGHHLFQLNREITTVRAQPLQVAAVLGTALFHLLTDSLLFGIVIGTIFLIVKFGVLPTLPLVIVAGFNVLIWSEHAWHSWVAQNRRVPATKITLPA